MKDCVCAHAGEGSLEGRLGAARRQWIASVRAPESFAFGRRAFEVEGGVTRRRKRTWTVWHSVDRVPKAQPLLPSPEHLQRTARHRAELRENREAGGSCSCAVATLARGSRLLGVCVGAAVRLA